MVGWSVEREEVMCDELVYIQPWLECGGGGGE